MTKMKRIKRTGLKGVSEWIFIIISVILGLFTIVVGSILLLRQADITQKQNVINQFSNLGVEMGRMCLKGGVGQTYYFPITLPDNTKAIYVSNASDEPPPDRVSVDISNRANHAGTYLCLQFFDENIPRCEKISCDMIFTYIGAPSLKSTLQTIIASLSGNTPEYKYYLFLNKTDYTLIQTLAIPIIGDALPSFTTTSTRANPIPSTTTTTTLPHGGI